MSSFFTIPKSQKRKRNDAPGSAPKKARTAPGGKRPHNSTRTQRNGTAREERDDSISGSESDDSAGDEGYESAETDASEQQETAAEKRLRLAEEYLEKVRQETEQEIGFDAEQIDRDYIAERLKEDVAEQKGKIYRFIAQNYEWQEPRGGFVRGNVDAKTTTAVAVSGQYVFMATKDLRILKWRIPDQATKKDATLTIEDENEDEIGVAKPQLSKSQRRRLRAKRKKEQGSGKNNRPILVASTKGIHKPKELKSYDQHTKPILCLACSPSGQLLVSGSADKRIIVWDAETLTPKRVFTQHRDAVTGLAFRRNADQMFSASADRTIKVWSMDQLAYVETLFGHQDEVLDVGALGMERCVSVGGRDRTVRVWKVVEETQLVFRGGGAAEEKEAKRDRKRGVITGEDEQERLDKKSKAAYGEGSLDRVALVDDEMFVTGSDNGSLSLWSTQKKKPVHILPLAHGLDPQLSLDEAFAEVEMGDREIPGPPLPRSITALAVLPYSDIVITGSWEGFLRVWKISDDKRRLEPAGTLGQIDAVEDIPLTINADGLVNGLSKKLIFEADVDGDNSEALNGDVAIGGTGETIEDRELQTQLSADAKPAEHGLVLPGKQNHDLSGIVNDLKITERGERGNETLIIAAAVGKEPRLGRWRTFPGRNGACVFEVSRRKGKGLPKENGVHNVEEEDSS